MKLKPIHDQVVVLIGCSSGIGRATAERFADQGAQLVLGVRDPDSIADLVGRLRAVADDPLVVTVDVVDPAALEQVAEAAVDHFGRIDTWVQLAAVSVYSTFESTSPTEFRRVVEVNLLGQAYGAMAALPRLRTAGGGALIEVSSVEAEVPMPYQAAYAASKHGMAGFLRSLRMELETEGAPIAVTQILPAGIDTPLFEHARTRLGVAPKPLAPVYDPTVVAAAIIHAAEHPTRDLYVGGAGLVAATAFKALPGLTSRLVARLGHEGQRSAQPKSSGEPDNLYSALQGEGRVRGDHPGRRWSLATWMQIHAGTLKAAAVVASIAATLAVRRRAS